MTARIINLSDYFVAYSGCPEMQKAERLERELRSHLRGRHDWLMEYRKWLDQKSIAAEKDGWPSAQAYDRCNISDFIRYQLMV
jgi:hypothetical protein